MLSESIYNFCTKDQFIVSIHKKCKCCRNVYVFDVFVGNGGTFLVPYTVMQRFTIWYGIVWYGMVWYGMVWYGMVWYGMVWYGMVWYGIVWYGKAQPTILDITLETNPTQIGKLMHIHRTNVVTPSPPVQCCKPWRNNFWYFAMIQSQH